MSLKVGITRFLGTNCDADIMRWMQLKNYSPEYLWYEDQFAIQDYDFLVIPGGFSHGDYLRCGAIAARTPVMKSVHEFAKAGRPVLGICNGFQILCEAGLLPGVLTRNQSLRFQDQLVQLKVQQNDNFFSPSMKLNQKLHLPIAHGEGNYFNTSDELKKMMDQDQVWLTYESNPNGALLNIAGITNREKNVAALMPHPERALFDWMGSSDGELFL